MKQRIKVESKNIGELFALPCVKTSAKTLAYNNEYLLIHSQDPDDFYVDVAYRPDTGCYGDFAYPGDWIVEEDDGTWRVEKGEEAEKGGDKPCEE